MKKKIVAWCLLLAMMITLVPAGSVQAATYKKNSSGTKVKYLQQNLSFLGFSTKGADGKFGGNTQKAVINAQKALQLPQTGIVEEELYTLISKTVIGIQTHLKNKGYYSGKIDGIAGTGTQTAFEKIQRDYGYARTGIADRYVLTEMVNDVEKSEETKSLREWVARLNGTYDDTLESDYYAKYGEEYLELFYKYPEVLDFYDVYIDYETKHANIVYKEAYKEQDEAIVWEGVANGVPFLINHLTGLFGVSEEEYDKLVYNTIMSLVTKMYYKDNDMYQAVKEINNAVSTFEGMYSFADESSKSILIQELMKLHPELTKETIKKIVDTIGEEWGGIAKFLDGSVTIVKYTVAATELYSISDEFIKQLKQSVKQPSLLYYSLCYLEEIKEQSVEEFLIRHLASELSVELIEGLLNEATGETYGAIVGTLRLLSDFFVQATVDEQQNTYMMRFYCKDLKDTLIEMRKDLVENSDLYIESEMNQKIKNYETTYNFYLCALETFYESALEMASEWKWWDRTKEVIQNDINFLKNYNYDLYVQMCLVEAKKTVANVSSIQDKLDYLLERLGATDGNVVYFTKNQKSCKTSFEYGHGDCANCSNSNVVQTGWFKDIFGYADAGNFPKHTITKTGERNNRGYSCFGFASFAQWYLYADSCTENVKGKEIKAVKFNKDNMMAYAQPGDIVRVNGHSVVVYSVEVDGMWVVDCNWDKNIAGEKNKNCVVQKHFFEYSMEKYAGKTAYINRVEKVIDGENKIGQFDINNLPATQIPVLKNGEKNTSVQYFQQNLHYLGYTVGDFDGGYGKKTIAAVKELQKDLHLEQTGEVNMYLYRLVNDSMKEIQQYLKEKGYYSSEIDGVAGTGTSKAITKLQKEWGMNATGRVTVDFMQKIVEKKGASVVPNLAEYVKLSK